MVKIGDIWYNDEFTYEVVCKCGEKFGCKRIRKIDGKEEMREYSDNFNYGKLLKRGKHIRPKANEPCSWDECDLFNIGTREEFDKVAKDWIVILDKNGELPTQNYLIIERYCREDLQVVIDSMMREGWKLQGGVSSDGNNFMQAMVKG